MGAGLRIPSPPRPCCCAGSLLLASQEWGPLPSEAHSPRGRTQGVDGAMPVRQRSVRDGGTGQVVVSPRAQPLALQAIWGAARTHTGAGGARPALSSWGPPLPDSCPGLLEVGSSPQFLPEVCPSPPGVPLPPRCAPPPEVAGPGGCGLQFGCIVFLRDTNRYFFPPCQEHVPSPPALLGALCGGFC